MTALIASSGQKIGAYYMLIAKRNRDGYPVGVVPDPETIANGTTMQPLLVTSITNFTPEKPTTSRVTNFGGQRIISQTLLGKNDLGTASFELSEYDERLIPLITNTVLDTTTIEGWAMTASNPDQTKFPRFFVIIGSRFTDTTTGFDMWMSRVYHNCQIEEADSGGISQADGTNPNPLTYNIIPSKSTRDFMGRTFSSSSGLFVTNASESVTRVRSLYALAFTSFKAAAASTTYKTGYRPVYDTATGAVNNSITKNGATFPATSLSTLTGDVVFSAGADADMHTLVYPTEFEPI